MTIEIKIPSPGESITEVELASWQVENGSYVEKDQEIAEVESDKATLPLIAEESGKIEILVEAGTTVKVGEIVCKIDGSAKPVTSKPSKIASKENLKSKETSLKESANKNPNESDSIKNENIRITPVASKMMEENDLSVDDILNGLRRISKHEVQAVIDQKSDSNFVTSSKKASRDVEKTKMSQLRKKISKRLVSVKNETAMLTTFNEVDMSEIILLRKNYGEKFKDSHGIKLGFMSFFTKAASVALQTFPNVNSMIDGEEILTPDYCDIGIAVQTPKGLMVPIIKNVELLSIPQIEKSIITMAERARNFKLSVEEMTGGTFTITNGGVFGSLLSTPIINPPQSAILGMHNIQERPVAIDGQVQIRPMMYLALSYDHRIIDGKDSVSFLIKIKELLENPTSMLFDGQDPERLLLNL